MNILYTLTGALHLITSFLPPHRCLGSPAGESSAALDTDVTYDFATDVTIALATDVNLVTSADLASAAILSSADAVTSVPIVAALLFGIFTGTVAMHRGTGMIKRCFLLQLVGALMNCESNSCTYTFHPGS